MRLNIKFIIAIGAIFTLTAINAVPSIDQLPVVSQIKSAAQAISGDLEGARETQNNFSRGIFLPAPVIRSAVEAIFYDIDSAWETWEQSANRLLSAADAIPVVGHVKGGIHYALGDTVEGDNSLQTSSRTVGIGIGGISGFLMGGPILAFTGGIAGGIGMDFITTVIKGVVQMEFPPILQEIIDIRFETSLHTDKILDTIAGPILDGATGVLIGYSRGILSVGTGILLQAAKAVNVEMKCRRDNDCCRDPIKIPHSNPKMMMSCIGKEVGEECRLICQKYYEATTKFVKCIKKEDEVLWDLGNPSAECRQVNDVACRDDSNNKVNWFVIYKPPTGHWNQESKNSRYIHITSRGTTWKTFNKNHHIQAGGDDFVGINGPPALDNTLHILQNSNVTYVMYSDQSPISFDKNEPNKTLHHLPWYALSKGMAAKEGNTGYFMHYTLPRFPALRDHKQISWSKLNGQVFICMTFNASSQWSNIVRYLVNLQPNIYAERGWKDAADKVVEHKSDKNEEDGRNAMCKTNITDRNLSNLKNSTLILEDASGQELNETSKEEEEGKSNKCIFEAKTTGADSVHSTYFWLFARHENGKQIYKTISKTFDRSFDVLSWANKTASERNLPSECVDPANVIKIRNIEVLDYTNSDVLEYVNVSNIKEGDDKYANWVVSTSSNIFCAVDMSRTGGELQGNNFGGAVCIQHPQISLAFDMLYIQREEVVCFSNSSQNS